MLSVGRALVLSSIVSALTVGLATKKSAFAAAAGQSLSARTLEMLPQAEPGHADEYEILLHSQSMAEQHELLTKILDNPQKYVPRIKQSLREYPQLLRSDPTAAKRVVYLAALVRDPSFPPILVRSLAVPDVMDECEYPCPAVFALTISARFAGWKLPSDLDSNLTTVQDLRAGIANISHVSLRAGSIEDIVQGPEADRYRKEFKGNTEEQMIQMAGPTTSSKETRTFAAY